MAIIDPGVDKLTLVIPSKTHVLYRIQLCSIDKGKIQCTQKTIANDSVHITSLKREASRAMLRRTSSKRERLEDRQRSRRMLDLASLAWRDTRFQ